MRIIRSATAVIILVALLAVPPALLVTFVGNPWPSLSPGWSVRFDDETVIGLLAVVAWILWVQLALCILAEVAGAFSGKEIRIPGLPAVERDLARQLVLVVLAAGAVGVTVPIGLPSATAAPIETSLLQRAAATEVDAAHVAQEAREVAPLNVTTVTVERGDTLWSLAERHLGDGAAFREIADLNEGRDVGAGRVFNASAPLVPGMRLDLPAGASLVDESELPETVVVTSGDTLWGLAEEHLDDGRQWPKLWKENRGHTFEDGREFEDPDLIQPGWELRIPDDPKSSELAQTESPDPADDDAPISARAVDHVAASAEPNEDVTPDTPAADDVEEGAPSWLLPGFLTGGGLLAGAALVSLGQRRAISGRQRRPGRVMEPPPIELAPVEKSIHYAGRPVLTSVDVIQRGLRQLARDLLADDKPVPRLVAVELRAGALVVHLSDASESPEGWMAEAGSAAWVISKTDICELGELDREDPWPLLVTVGHDDRGSAWLINLEGAHVGVDGDTDAAQDFIRFVTAELACNPWSARAEVHLAGIAHEVAAMNPIRLSYSASVEAVLHDVLARVEREKHALETAGLDPASARAHEHGAELWPSHCLVIDTRSDESHDEVMKARRHLMSAPFGLLTVGTGRSDQAIWVGKERRTRIESLGLELHGVGLAHDEAIGCAALLAQGETAQDTVPPSMDSDDGWRRYATTSGHLREEFCTPRSVETLMPSSSVLPLSDAAYLSVAPVVTEDLESLAPKVTEEVTNLVTEADPNLDADVNDWFNHTTPRPKLRLLGEVEVFVSADVPTALKSRRMFLAELLAFIDSKERGATSAQICEAFGLSPRTAKSRIADLRRLLGEAEDGSTHLPDGRASGRFRVPELLTDVDLFRRLRVRGTARGADGIDDLALALSLVDGMPFSAEDARSDGRARSRFLWLVDNPLDHAVVPEISDISLVVITAALESGDLPLAQAALLAALKAAPGEEATLLAHEWVLEAAGETREAQRVRESRIDSWSSDVGRDPSPRVVSILSRMDAVGRGQ
jgi:LysM repeat protein